MVYIYYLKLGSQYWYVYIATQFFNFKKLTVSYKEDIATQLPANISQQEQK